MDAAAIPERATWAGDPPAGEATERPSAAAEVRRRLPELLSRGDASLEATAKAMVTSARTLQRHSRDEDTSHRALLDEVRPHLAARYLARPELSAAEVGFLLGFADPASFHRAFKRWTGTTPADHRRRG